MVDKNLAKVRANKIRNSLGLGQRPISDIFTLLEDIGLILFKKPINNSSLSAIFMQDKKNYLVIINSNRTLGHQMFSAAHELSHYYFDNGMLGGICSVSNSNVKNDIEELADEFASNFLMPDEGLIALVEKRKNKDGKLDLFDLVFLQQYFRVSWIAILKKLKTLNYISSIEEYKDVGITRLTQMLGYNTELVSKTKEYDVSKRYLESVLKCYENDEISEIRLKEYLEDVSINISDISGLDEIKCGGGDNED